MDAMSDQLMLFAEDIHASHSASPGSEEARRMTAISGLSIAGLSKNSGPLGCLEKTLLGTSRWVSTVSYLTWNASATPAGCLLFRLVPLTLATSENELGLLPTPTAGESNDYGTNWKSLARLDKGGRIMRRLANRFLPTPNASDDGDRGGPSNPAIQRRMDIGKQLNLSMHWDGPLSPLFVEEMMGFPEGWTEIGCGHSEMPLSRKSRKSSAKQSCEQKG